MLWVMLCLTSSVTQRTKQFCVTFQYTNVHSGVMSTDYRNRKKVRPRHGCSKYARFYVICSAYVGDDVIKLNRMKVVDVDSFKLTWKATSETGSTICTGDGSEYKIKFKVQCTVKLLLCVIFTICSKKRSQHSEITTTFYNNCVFYASPVSVNINLVILEWY